MRFFIVTCSDFVGRRVLEQVQHTLHGRVGKTAVLVSYEGLPECNPIYATLRNC